MGFFQRLGMRLGFILVLALTIRVIGGLFSPAHPKQEVEMAEWPGNPGVKIPKSAIESSALAAPLDDPIMQQALTTLSGTFQLGEGDEGKMTFRSASGPVTLTPTGLRLLNDEYRRIKARGDTPT